MPDDAATAVCASLSQCFNRTLEAVEEVVFLIYANDESLIVIVAAHFTPGHTRSPSKRTSLFDVRYLSSVCMEFQNEACQGVGSHWSRIRHRAIRKSPGVAALDVINNRRRFSFIRMA